MKHSGILKRLVAASLIFATVTYPSVAAIQLSTRVRNAMLDAMETIIGTSAHIQIWTGTQPANCGTAASGTKLADFALASDWAAAASGGSKAFSNMPLTTTGITNGNAGYYRLVDSTNPTATCDEQGTITVTGGGGDMTIDNVSIATGQTVNITGWTWTEPGA